MLAVFIYYHTACIASCASSDTQDMVLWVLLIRFNELLNRFWRMIDSILVDYHSEVV